jgi:protein-tyrosine phosphatase
MKHILFVCTGNIFRSMIAEYALSQAAGTDSPYVFSSAGTEAKAQKMDSLVHQLLHQSGLKPNGHQQRRLTPEIFTHADLIVSIGLDHAAYIQEHFGHEAVLFNQIAYGQRQPILDTWEAVPDFADNNQARQAHIRQVVAHISDAAPDFLSNLPTWLK